MCPNMNKISDGGQVIAEDGVAANALAFNSVARVIGSFHHKQAKAPYVSRQLSLLD